MAANNLTYFPVGNGDTALIELDKKTILTDMNYRDSAADPDQDDYDFAPDLQKACLVSSKNYRLSLFVLTHPDADHLRGFATLFYCGDPDKYKDRKVADEKLILIEEMFISPYAEQPNYEPKQSDSIASRAAARGVTPEEEVYDLLLKDEGRGKLLVALGNFPNYSLDDVLKMFKHPNAVIGLGDGGAHYGLICDASYPTFVLTHWVRDREGKRIALEEAVKALTSDPAWVVGLRDRGLLRPGYKADINVIDLAALRLHTPRVVQDLPAGGKRLDQGADGFVATFVAGKCIARNGVPTGNFPGRLVRGRRAVPTESAGALA